MVLDRKHFVGMIAFLFILRCAAVWCGFDRLPYLSNNDEAGFNDPALCMVEGKGLVSEGLEGAMGMEKVFSQYPPVYMSVQAQIFKWFGLNTFTLRGPSVLFFCVYTFLLLLLFSRLRLMGLFDDYSAAWVALLLLSDPTTLAACRQGRCESLALLFSIAAFSLLFSKEGVVYTKTKWAVSAVLIGLALSTHFSMANTFIVFTMMTVIMQWKRSKSFTLLLVCVPVIVLAIIWVVVHGERSWDAAAQFWRIKEAFHAPSIEPGPNYLRGFRLGYLLNAFIKGQLETFNQHGGFSMLVVSFAWFTIGVRILWGFIKRAAWNESQNNALLIVGLFCFSNMLVIAIFMGSTTQRIVTILPIALVGLGAAIAHLQLSRNKRALLTVCLAMMVAAGIAGNVIYLRKVLIQWEDRDPDRFIEFVKDIPLDSNIAATYLLWYEFKRTGRKVRIIGSGMIGAHQYLLDNPEVIDKYDTIILSEGLEFLEDRLKDRRVETVTIKGKDFVSYHKIK